MMRSLVICSNGVTWSQNQFVRFLIFGLVYLFPLTNKGASICFWGIWGHSVYIQVALIINLTHTKLSVSGILLLFFVSCWTISLRMQFTTFLEMCYKLFKLTKPLSSLCCMCAFLLPKAYILTLPLNNLNGMFPVFGWDGFLSYDYYFGK